MQLPGQQPRANYFVYRWNIWEEPHKKELVIGPTYYEIGLTWLRSHPTPQGVCHELSPFNPEGKML